MLCKRQLRMVAVGLDWRMVGGWQPQGFTKWCSKVAISYANGFCTRKTCISFFWVGCFWDIFFCFFLIWGDNTKREGWSLIVSLFNHSFWTCAIFIMKGTAFFLLSSGPNDRTTACRRRQGLPPNFLQKMDRRPWRICPSTSVTSGRGSPENDRKKGHRTLPANLWVFYHALVF